MYSYVLYMYEVLNYWKEHRNLNLKPSFQLGPFIAFGNRQSLKNKIS